MSEMGVRRAKAALSSECKSQPANAPAGSNRGAMEVTKWLKPSVSVSRNTVTRACVQTVTRVNAEQADAPPSLPAVTARDISTPKQQTGLRNHSDWRFVPKTVLSICKKVRGQKVVTQSPRRLAAGRRAAARGRGPSQS